VRSLARRVRASSVASGRVLPVGTRPVRARVPPGSGCFPVWRTRSISQEKRLESTSQRGGIPTGININEKNGAPYVFGREPPARRPIA
jgi:hypothetical protein